MQYFTQLEWRGHCWARIHTLGASNMPLCRDLARVALMVMREPPSAIYLIGVDPGSPEGDVSVRFLSSTGFYNG